MVSFRPLSIHDWELLSHTVLDLDPSHYFVFITFSIKMQDALLITSFTTFFRSLSTKNMQQIFLFQISVIHGSDLTDNRQYAHIIDSCNSAVSQLDFCTSNYPKVW